MESLGAAELCAVAASLGVQEMYTPEPALVSCLLTCLQVCGFGPDCSTESVGLSRFLGLGFRVGVQEMYTPEPALVSCLLSCLQVRGLGEELLGLISLAC